MQLNKQKKIHNTNCIKDFVWYDTYLSDFFERLFELFENVFTLCRQVWITIGVIKGNGLVWVDGLG